MNYLEKIDKILKENMTENLFCLWEHMKKSLPNIWNRPTSSSGKYHHKENRRVPTCAEHTYEMLHAFIKIMPAFSEPKTIKTDCILLSIALHDSCKYGVKKEVAEHARHTNKYHPRWVADLFVKNRNIFLKVMDENNFSMIEESVRYHSGRWSPDIKKGMEFSFENFKPETQLLHTLDMLSTYDVLKTD